MIATLADWLDHRVGYRKFLNLMLIEHIPGGARWRYVWGSCLAFVFTVQMLTGILLMTAYSPSDISAWASVYFIQYEMDFGWLIRGLHHFGSQTMVVLLAVHMLQVVIAGAHLPPREVNWWLGIALMAVTLGMSLTGYLLPWDQKGFFATQVATNIAGTLPGIGTFLQKIVVGGPNYGNHTLTRFFTLHVWVLPALLILLVVLHLVSFRRHGVTAPAKPGQTLAPGVAIARDLFLAAIVFAACYAFHVSLITASLMAGIFVIFALSRLSNHVEKVGWFWPDQAFRDLIVCLMIFAVMLSLVLYGGHGNSIPTPPGANGEAPGLYERWAKAGKEGLGANLDAPADPDTEGYPARPEWYFLFLFQLLKYFEGEQILLGTVVIPNGAFVLLLILPLLGYGKMRKFGHYFGILVVVVLLSGAAALTVLAIAADSPTRYPPEPFPISFGGGDKKSKDLEHAFHVAHAQALRAVEMASQGIPVEGARDMVRNDPVNKGPQAFKTHCATCHTHDADERGSQKVEFNDPKTKYKAGDLTGYAGEKWIRGLLANPGHEKYFGRTNLEGMKNWRERVERDREKWKKKLGEEEAQKKIAQQEASFDLLARFLVQQSIPVKERDGKLQREGLEAFEDQKCAQCHKLGEEGPSQGPNLTDYGSPEWLRLMIMAPDHPTRYGATNQMPAFLNVSKSTNAHVTLLQFHELYKKPPEEKADEEKKDDEKKDAKDAANAQKPRQPTVMDLDDVQRELIIRWLTNDRRVVFGGRPISAAR